MKKFAAIGALVLGLAATTPAFAAGPVCRGTFLRDVQGQAVVETGDLEPAGEHRRKGDVDEFTGSDRFEGLVYYERRGGYFYPAKAVKLSGGCRLKRLR